MGEGRYKSIPIEFIELTTTSKVSSYQKKLARRVCKIFSHPGVSQELSSEKRIILNDGRLN